MPSFHCTLCLFLFCSILSSTSSQRAGKRCSTEEVAYPVALESRNGTFSSAINPRPTDKLALKSILSHFKELGRTLDRNDPKTGGIWRCGTTSTSEDLTWEHSLFGWYFPPPFCAYFIHADTPPIDFSRPRDVFKAIRRFHSTVLPFGSSVASSYGLLWTKTFTAGVLKFRPPDKYRKCELARALGYRFNRTWAATAVVTNFSANIAVNARGTLKELITVDSSNSVRPVSLSTHSCEKDGPARLNGTGILKTPSGSIPWPHFDFGVRSWLKEDLPISPAIVQALQKGNFEKEMVVDSSSFSNLAILLLPVILALLPIAVFQDASVMATVLYAVATDMVSVLPIAIKGAELVVYGSRRHYAFNSNLYGMNGSAVVKVERSIGPLRIGKRIAMTETWAAECRMNSFVRQRGIGLLALAVAAMMLGIVLEVLARRFAEKRKEHCAWRNAAVFEHEALIQQLPGYFASRENGQYHLS